MWIWKVDMSSEHYVLKLACSDRVGIVAAVSTLIADLNGWIVDAQHHTDLPTAKFFTRQVVKVDTMSMGLDEFRDRFKVVADEFEMDWLIRRANEKKRVVILVSKMDHCLNNLLYRWRTGDLSFDLVGVISNHDDCRELVQWHGVPYVHIPISKTDKTAGFAKVREQVDQWGTDTLVLARYMQILPPDFCEAYPGRIINIHHSFLPSFVGAKPYHQAYERGVKWVGATCHYVTGELDAGPIIEQDATRTHHAHSVEQMIQLGRNTEVAVLTRGVHNHLEDRVFINGNKTVVFA